MAQKTNPNSVSKRKFATFAALGLFLVIAAVGAWFVFNNTSTNSDASAATKAEKMYALRHDYVGNSSANIKLLNELKLSKLSPYTIELMTSKRPYILHVHFSDMTVDLTSDTVKNETKTAAAILLALIKNVDEVHFGAAHATGDMLMYTAETYKNDLGDIKEYRETFAQFEAMLAKIEQLGQDGKWCADNAVCNPVSNFR